MATRLEVQRFLRTFHAKLKVFDILFRDDRGKNQQALFDLAEHEMGYPFKNEYGDEESGYRKGNVCLSGDEDCELPW